MPRDSRNSKNKSGDHWKWKMQQKPQRLESKDIKGVAKYMKSKKCMDIVLMIGAGVSTSAGIPDFRSPGTGLYSNLKRLNLPHPEAVFEINYFRRNPVPFYTLAQELYPGKFRPTLTHSFIKLLESKHILLKCFTQNIDTLERRAGVSNDKIIEAHGSFATQRCIDCKFPYDEELIKVHIKEKSIPRCERVDCGGLVKPDIVFFGESLPDEFLNSITLLNEADLLIVMGTSLQVHPFAMLAELPQDDIPRVLINMERVGDFADRSDDVLLLGKCDEMVLELCKELGWDDELMDMWKETEGSVVVDNEDGKDIGKEEVKAEKKDESGKEEKDSEEAEKAKEEAENIEQNSEEKPESDKDDDEEIRQLIKEVEFLTSAIEQSLAISDSAPLPEKETPTAPINSEAENLEIPKLKSKPTEPDTSSTSTSSPLEENSV